MVNKFKKIVYFSLIVIALFGLAEVSKINNKKLLSNADNEMSSGEDIEVGNEVEELPVEEEQINKEEEELVIPTDPLFNPRVNILERINTYLEHDINNVGFIYYNLVTGEEISINKDLAMEAASTYKVGLNIVAYDMIKKGEISLEDVVYFNDSQFQEGSGVLQFEEELTALHLHQLLEYSIVHSDNIASTMIYDYIGGWNSYRTKLIELVGIDNKLYNNITTAENEFKVLKYLYDNRSDKYLNHLIEDMKNTEFHDRVDKYLPNDIVAHKIGDMDWAAHDMGIVFTEEPYILVVLTDGIYNSYDVIADISKAMYLYNLN